MAGAFMLLALILLAPAASAHAHGMGGATHPAEMAERPNVMRASLPSSSEPGCDDSSFCCMLCQCVHVTSVQPSKLSAPKAILTAPAAYTVVSTTMNPSLRSGPATPPPRLDA